MTSAVEEHTFVRAYKLSPTRLRVAPMSQRRHRDEAGRAISRLGFGACALAGLMSVAAAAGKIDASPRLTVDQILEKNVAARGGLDAWRKIQTMVWTGRIETGNPAASTEAFVLEMKRPNKTRFEVRTRHDRNVRVFDGANGWKIQASDTGAPALKRYTPLEVRSAHESQGIDGLLIDHRANGIEVALDDTDQVEGHEAYRLNVTLPSGAKRTVWVDAQTFLELKHEREARTAGGHAATMSVFYRNYRTIDGLQIPMTIETPAQEGRAAVRMTIDAVTLNPSLSDAHFERPSAQHRHRAPPGLQSAAPAEGALPHALVHRVAVRVS